MQSDWSLVVGPCRPESHLSPLRRRGAIDPLLQECCSEPMEVLLNIIVLVGQIGLGRILGGCKDGAVRIRPSVPRTFRKEKPRPRWRGAPNQDHKQLNVPVDG